jgi:hypothetical protein
LNTLINQNRYAAGRLMFTLFYVIQCTVENKKDNLVEKFFPDVAPPSWRLSWRHPAAISVVTPPTRRLSGAVLFLPIQNLKSKID